MKKNRDVDKVYPLNEFVSKLRRLADSLEAGEPFQIQIKNERINVPGHAACSIQHERGDGEEEIEFQISWTNGK